MRDRDGSYAERFREAAQWLGIREVLPAPQSPWQNAHVEWLIGSIRGECSDHVIFLSETGLRRILNSQFDYYEQTRTHLLLKLGASDRTRAVNIQRHVVSDEVMTLPLHSVKRG